MDSGRSFQLTKSLYMAGLQCARQFWWLVHHPDSPELGHRDVPTGLLKRGRAVGVLAREYVPGGLLIGAPGHDRARWVAETARALDAGHDVLYEAAFVHDGVFVATDILERRRSGWTLIEVKSSTKVKDEHHPDVALQAHVVRGAGLAVDRVEVMHLNRECRFPDLSDLFVRVDVGDRVEPLVGEVPGVLAELREVIDGPDPEPQLGYRCTHPNECPLKGFCWVDMPEHSLHTLYRGNRLRDLVESLGIETVDEIPDGVPLNEIQERQRRSVQTGEPVVEPGLGDALETLEYPIAYLDFETVAPAVPVWEGLRPYDATPVLISVHIEDSHGDVAHHKWVADGPTDPREEAARRLVEFTAGAGSIVHYTAFEPRLIRDLADRVPGAAEALRDVLDRLWDLHAVVKSHVYHAGFRGSFGIKSVLPALVPRGGWDGLEVADGLTASFMLEELLFGNAAPHEQEDVKQALMTYCETDTSAMLQVVGALRRLSIEAP